jgi:hypothetical protein
MKNVPGDLAVRAYLIGRLTLDTAKPKTTSKDEENACGMIKRMMSYTFGFLTEVALMRDVIDVLHTFSLHLQKRAIGCNHRFQGPARYRSTCVRLQPYIKISRRDNIESRQETVEQTWK